MANNETHKNNRIISFDKLTDELKEQFAEAYPQPDGYDPYLKKIIKPDGTPICVVPFETEDTVYMVKFEVKIDSPMAEDELEKDLFGDSTKGSEMSDMDIMEQNDNGEKDEAHREFTLNHGDYEKAYAEEAAMADATSDNAFGSDDDEETDEDLDDDDLLDDDMEPDEDDLLDIELEMMEAEQEEEKNEKKSKKSSSKSTPKAKKTTEKKTAKKAESKSSAKSEKTAKPAKETSKKPKKDQKKSK